MATVSDVTTPPLSHISTVDAVLDTGPGWNWVTPGRNVLYYTFSISPSNSSDGYLLLGNGTRFNAAQEPATLPMLSYVSQVTGIVFAATSDGNAADLHFVAADLADPGFAGYCSWNWRYRNLGDAVTSYFADAYIYLDNVNYTTQTNAPTLINYGYELILHELGHALGLKHSFAGSVTLPPGEDDTAHSLMSYSRVGGPHETYSPYDLDALKWLYGGDGLGGMWGINSVNGPSLSTPDSTPPSVIAFSPQDEAAGVAVGANIVVSFSEA